MDLITRLFKMLRYKNISFEKQIILVFSVSASPVMRLIALLLLSLTLLSPLFFKIHKLFNHLFEIIYLSVLFFMSSLLL